MLPKKLAFVDIETTGMRISYDRIIEVGVLRVEDNKLVSTLQSLLDPGGYLPPDITLLTGIASEQLEGAPTFRQIKDKLLEIFEDCIFVAHNVRFDYGFLKQEFKRLDLNFSPKHFCTVKLARKLFPKLENYNLDSIIEKFGISCLNRHRAFDDAKVIFDFYQIAQKSVSENKFLESINLALKRPSLPLKVSIEDLEKLPENPGVYIFYGEKGAPLYIGKSINIRERILSHFSADHSSSTEMKISQQIESIETVETTGELGALLLESSLIKKMQPLYNRVLRRKKQLVVLKKIKNKFGFDTVEMQITDGIDVSEVDQVLGVFRSAKFAKDFLISVAKKYFLCEKILGVEKTLKGCFSYRLGRCFGACVQKESVMKYNLRFLTAFAGLKFQAWPFAGPILIEEKNLDGKKEIFIVDKWCFLGSIKKSSDKLLKNVLNQDYSFDLDTYKILHRFLNSDKNVKLVKGIKIPKKINYKKSEEEYFVNP